MTAVLQRVGGVTLGVGADMTRMLMASGPALTITALCGSGVMRWSEATR